MEYLPEEYENYTIIRDSDLIPDTNLIAYVNDETEEIKVFESKPIGDEWRLLGLLVTKTYYRTAELVREHYKEVKECCDSIRASDDQYEDPSEWSARESYEDFYKDGYWSEIFWDII